MCKIIYIWDHLHLESLALVRDDVIQVRKWLIGIFDSRGRRHYIHTDGQRRKTVNQPRD